MKCVYNGVIGGLSQNGSTRVNQFGGMIRRVEIFATVAHTRISNPGLLHLLAGND